MSPKTNSKSKAGHTSSVIKAVAVVAVIVALVIATQRFDLQQLFRNALAWISSLGPIGQLIFVALYIIACVLLLPGSILTLGAGVVFGVVNGSIAVSIGATLGATCAFLVGRYLARDWEAKRIAGKENSRQSTKQLQGMAGKSCF
jgi:uncharacterized membrane protein YdjX (TVP38/TMEM64 family)